MQCCGAPAFSAMDSSAPNQWSSAPGDAAFTCVTDHRAAVKLINATQPYLQCLAGASCHIP